MDEPPVLRTPTRPTWWNRNWIWFLPSLGLGMLTFVGGAVALFLMLIFGLLKSSDVYRQALAQAQADPEVVRALGAPVSPGLWVTGNIKINGNSGKAELAIPIHGPKDGATVFVVASKSDGQWEFDDLVVEVKATHRRIDLLAPPPEPAAPPESPPDEKVPPPAPDSLQI